MVSEVILSSEGFLANVAFERSLVGVSSFVDHQVVTLREFTVTEPGRGNSSLKRRWKTDLQICCFFGRDFLFVTVLSTVADSASLWKSNFLGEVKLELSDLVEDKEENAGERLLVPWKFSSCGRGAWRIW